MALLDETRDCIKTAIDGATGGAADTLMASARIFLGWKTRLDQTDNVFNVVRSAGPVAIIGPAKSVRLDSLGFGPASYDMRVYLYKSKGSDFDCKDIDRLVGDILSRIVTESYYTGNAVLPDSAALVNWSYDYQSCDGLILLEFSINVPDP